jgi:chromosomal replication initiation ATPase DnaA
LPAKEIAERVCLAYQIDEAGLKAQSQQRVVSEARAVVGWLARELGCVTLSAVARHVNRDVGSISSAVRRLSDRMQEVPELADRVRSLKAALEKET